MLTRLRFCDAQGRADFRTSGGPGSGRKGFKPWFRHKHRATRDVRMAFGHWAALGLRVKKRYVALDSGCVWGGQLTAWSDLANSGTLRGDGVVDGIVFVPIAQ